MMVMLAAYKHSRRTKFVTCHIYPNENACLLDLSAHLEAFAELHSARRCYWRRSS